MCSLTDRYLVTGMNKCVLLLYKCVLLVYSDRLGFRVGLRHVFYRMCSLIICVFSYICVLLYMCVLFYMFS